jgi:DHA2 family multidrug resistance protein
MATVTAHAPDEPHILVRQKALLTAAVMLAMVMQVLDATIANVALPHMQASLGATQDSISWVLTSYIVASAVAIPLTGWLANRYGARNLLLFSVALFVFTSALCGIAANLPEMVAFRLAQGIGGAFIGPLAQTIMLDINKPSSHGRAMSVYGMGVMIGPIVGPVLGGYLTEAFNWRWVFFINLPLGIICFFALWLLLPRVENQARKFDFLGWAMIAIALSGFQLLLDRGQHVDWFSSTEIWIEAGIALSAFWLFVVHSVTTKRPLFPPSMLRDVSFMAGVLLTFVMGMVMMSSMALLPTMMQTLFGYPVIETGEVLASRGLGVLVMMAITGRLLSVVDARLIALTGFVLCSLSVYMMTGWSLEIDWRYIVASGFVQGLGVGCVFVPLNVLAFSSLPPHLRTDGASLFNLSRNIGSSVGVASMAALLSRNIQVSHADLAAHVTPYNLPMDPNLLRALGAPGESAMAMLDGIINQQAAMIAYLDDFKAVMIATLCSLPLLLLLRKPQGGGGPLPVISE